MHVGAMRRKFHTTTRNIVPHRSGRSTLAGFEENSLGIVGGYCGTTAVRLITDDDYGGDVVDLEQKIARADGQGVTAYGGRWGR